MPINKEKLALRAEVAKKRPKFKRAESWRYKRLETSWRKPKGIDNNQSKQKSRGSPGIVKVGYGGPKITRGLPPSGYTDNLVFTINDLKKLNPHTDGIRFGHTVGTRKRKAIIIEAIEKKFKIFNARVSESASKS